MQLSEEEELVWHHAIRISDGFCLGTPVHRETCVFVNQVWMVVAWGLIIMVWHERKQAVGICITVTKLDGRPVGFESLDTSTFCSFIRSDSKQDIIFHEAVLWFRVTRKAVHQNSKINVGERWMGLDLSVRLGKTDFFLQLEQNVFPIPEEGVHNLLSIWSSCDASGKEIVGSISFNDFTSHLAVDHNGISILQRLNFIHAAYCVGLKAVAAPGKLKKKRYTRLGAFVFINKLAY